MSIPVPHLVLAISAFRVVALVLLGLFLGYYLIQYIRSRNEKQRNTGTTSLSLNPASAKEVPPGEQTPDPRNAEVRAAKTRHCYALAEEVERNYTQSAHPGDLLVIEPFRKGVRILSSKSFDGTDRVRFATGNNYLTACMALQAMKDLGDEEAPVQLLAAIENLSPWAFFFALEVLRARPPEEYLATLLKDSPEWWPENGFIVQFLAHHFSEMTSEGSDFKLVPPPSDWSSKELERAQVLLASIGPDAIRPVNRELDRAKAQNVDVEYLQSIGRVWSRDEASDRLISHQQLDRQTQVIASTLIGDSRRSLVVVGDPGAGKTALVRSLARLLPGWTFLEARAADVLADQKFLGELEGRESEIWPITYPLLAASSGSFPTCTN